MKKIIVIVIVGLLLIIGCGKDSEIIKIDSLILEQESIDSIGIYKNQDGTPTWTLNESQEIKNLVNMVKEITVEKLTKKKDIEFMKQGQKLIEEGLLIVFMFNNQKTTGQFFIWPDGRIYVIDTESMTGNKRTISYLSEKTYPKIYDTLLKNK